MTQLGLFRVHRNDCDTQTEVFVEVFTDDNNVQFGFCIEKDERTAQQWEDARDTCLSEKKRLPEPGEWKFACDTAAGLNNMTDDGEWVSNFPLIFERPGNKVRGPIIPSAGDGSCGQGSFGQMLLSSGTPTTWEFRCVR